MKLGIGRLMTGEMVALCALVSLFIVQPAVVSAAPIALTVDASASELGGVPLGGTVAANFDNGNQSLIFLGGSNISLLSPLLGSGTIPNSTIFNVAGITATAVGSYQTTLASLQLDLTSGTVSDNSTPDAPGWTAVGTGSLTGSLDLEIVVLGSVSHTTINFSATLTAISPFTSSPLLDPVGLGEISGIVSLSLPFNMTLAVTSIEFDGGGLTEGISDGVRDLLEFAPIPIEGIVIASSTLEVPEPATLALFGAGLLGLGLRRRVNW